MCIVVLVMEEERNSAKKRLQNNTDAPNVGEI
jgi:hypothetical protein